MKPDYTELIARKAASTPSSGFNATELAPHLFPHQRDLVRWALRRGRAAIFADTGLGKGLMLLEWARQVSAHGRVIILAPLAVGPQLETEASKWGVSATYVRDDSAEHRIVITNYEMLAHFDASAFVGVVLDESSILKSYDGKTKDRLMKAFGRTPYRLACTATPAPNDFTELGNHSEFLGLKSRVEMLAEYFVHDGGSTQDWRVKGHAVTPFWRWVATWGAVVKMPSDLGYDDGGFALPPLEMIEHVVPSTDHDVRASGQLFAMEARTLQEQRAVRRGTIGSRVKRTADIIRESKRDQFVVWCELNDEQDALAEELGERVCVSIAGSTDDDDKIEMHERWLKGKARVLVSKPAIFGFGLNWQHCHRVIFIGASHSYERTYQSIRRCWRFGQKHAVTVELVRSDLESAIVENYRRKESDAAKMAAEMTAHVGDAVRAEVRGLSREFNPYQPSKSMALPEWL
jgi:superfamily II DNA or RNA helicase